MNESPSRASCIAGALAGLALPAAFIAIGAYGGLGLAHFIVSTAPREIHLAHLHRADMLHRDTLNYAIGYGYMIASTLAGVGFIVRRMQERIVWLLFAPPRLALALRRRWDRRLLRAADHGLRSNLEAHLGFSCPAIGAADAGDKLKWTHGSSCYLSPALPAATWSRGR
jgi:hypothetical protein